MAGGLAAGNDLIIITIIITTIIESEGLWECVLFTDVASRSHLSASDVAARSHLYAYLKISSSWGRKKKT